MAYTTTQLITGAFYSAGIDSREFETVSGPEYADALIWLNDIIAEKDVDEEMIPYETTYTQNFVPGQSIYFIPGLIQIDTLTFFLNNVRYGMVYTKRNEFFGSSRAEDIQTMPWQWYFEPSLGGGNLHVYFSPDRNYPMELHGVFSLPQVTQGQDLSTIFPRFLITYFRYLLADRICTEYAFTTPPGVMKEIDRLESFIGKKSRILDLSMQKVSTLQRHGSINNAFANLSEGFWPTQM